MKILGLDTTTKFLCLGASDASNIFEYNLQLDRKLSAQLTPTIKRVLAALKWRVSDIDYFACGLGPGSFTGMRVGISAIKGLAWLLKKPVVGILSLDILAMNAVSLDAGVIAVAIDARRGLIYCGIYQKKNNAIKRISPYMLLTMDEFLRKINNSGLNGQGILVLGDAAALYSAMIIKEASKVRILDRDYWYPQGHNIIRLAQEGIRQRKISSCFDIEPIYLYPKECQIRSHQGHRGHQSHR